MKILQDLIQILKTNQLKMELENRERRLHTILFVEMEERGLVCGWNEKLEYFVSSSLKSKEGKFPVVGDETICKQNKTTH